MVVQLTVFVVDTESRSNDGLAPEHRGRPGESYARIDVAVIRFPETGPNSAKPSRTATRKIERIRATQHFMECAEEAVTRSQIYCEIRPQLEFILEVSEVLRFAQAVYRQRAHQSG